jgi:hypothetical protein
MGQGAGSRVGTGRFQAVGQLDLTGTAPHPGERLAGFLVGDAKHRPALARLDGHHPHAPEVDLARLVANGVRVVVQAAAAGPVARREGSAVHGAQV